MITVSTHPSYECMYIWLCTKRIRTGKSINTEQTTLPDKGSDPKKLTVFKKSWNMHTVYLPEKVEMF